MFGIKLNMKLYNYHNIYTLLYAKLYKYLIFFGIGGQEKRLIIADHLPILVSLESHILFQTEECK